MTRSLAASADRLARELDVSRNDALLRMAMRGAHLYEEELRIAERREQRWAAVLASRADSDAESGYPSPDEAHDAVASAREGREP